MKKTAKNLISIIFAMSLCACSSGSQKSSAVADSSNTLDLSEVIDELAAKQEEEYNEKKKAEEAQQETVADEVSSNVRLMSWNEPVDVDLTQMSATMIYSEVYNMLIQPEEYLGKTIRIFGMFTSYHAPDDKYYYACIVQDATACCAQGLEFVLNDSYAYPDDYPVDGDEVVVTGRFETYEDGNYIVIHLYDAVIEDYTPRQQG